MTVPREVYSRVHLAGDERRSDVHRPSSREALAVTVGSVTITIAGAEPVTLTKGQSAAFAAGVDHQHANGTRRPARFTVAVHESS